MKKRQYVVSFRIKRCARIEVCAENEDEAKKIAEQKLQRSYGSYLAESADAGAEFEDIYEDE